MNEYSTGLTLITLAALGIGAMYAQPLARRIRDSVLIARDRERLNCLAPIASENFDELLVAIPGASTAKLSNTRSAGTIPPAKASQSFRGLVDVVLAAVLQRRVIKQC